MVGDRMAQDAQGLEVRNWAHGGHRRAGVCGMMLGWQRGQGTGWHWGWRRDSGDMRGFLKGHGEDRVMLGVAEGPWGCPLHG